MRGTCPNCGGDDIQSHSLSWWCGRCGQGGNFDGSVGPRRPNPPTARPTRDAWCDCGHLKIEHGATGECWEGECRCMTTRRRKAAA
jgi:hypothetical protein